MLIEMLPFPLNRIGLVIVELGGRWDGGDGKNIAGREKKWRKKEIDQNHLCSSKARIYPRRIFGGNYSNLPFFIN